MAKLKRLAGRARPGRKHGTSAPATRSKTQIERLVAERFLDNWRSVAADLSAGIDIAKEYAGCFWASGQRERLRMARRYYAPARAAKLAEASVDEILHLSDAWLPAFRRYADQEELESVDALREELRYLVRAEYVAVTWKLPDANGRISQESIPWMVHALPGGALYDDVYELTASGVSCGKRLRICKSVAEPFGESERLETMVGIENDFFSNAASDGEPKGKWQINFRDPGDSRLIEADVELGPVNTI